MSDTSDRLASAVQSVLDLRTAGETPAGEDGDSFAETMDELAESTKARFDAIVNSDDEVTADVDNQVTNSEEGHITEADIGSLSVGETGPVTGIAGDSGEWEPMWAHAHTPLSTTSTDFVTNGNQSSDFFQVDWDRFDVTGVADVGVSAWGKIGGSQGVVRAARLNKFSNLVETYDGTEHSNSTDGQTFESDLAPLGNPSGWNAYGVALKSPDGTSVSTQQVGLRFWRLIE